MTRIATLHLPGFGLQVAARARPELRARPLAMEGDPPDTARVVECSRSAAQAGVREGQSLSRARLACPELVVLRGKPDDSARARREIHEALLLVGPG